MFSPDRLARKYAYQVLLLEEFRRAGCEVVFLHHPISDDPNDQLLLQIQGAIAEYERAVLAERFRRGKLQKARDGNIISAKVPYGYRYESRCGALPARLVIDDAEACMVRQLYAWVRARTAREVSIVNTAALALTDIVLVASHCAATDRYGPTTWNRLFGTEFAPCWKPLTS